MLAVTTSTVLWVGGAAGASASRAATLTVREPTGQTTYVAAPDEANRVDILQVDAHTVRIVDTGATIASTPPCRSLSAHTSECTGLPSRPTGYTTVTVQAGDMDDVVQSHGPGLNANGGPANDTLNASSTLLRSFLNGGAGNDRIRGGHDEDDLNGNAGADRINGGLGRDHICGRPRQ